MTPENLIETGETSIFFCYHLKIVRNIYKEY